MIVEQILLGFRSDVGVSKELFSQSQIARLGLLEDEKIIIKTDNRYYNQNYLLADELVLFVDKQVD
jgi:oxygen-independent coproporphyrinogen-3 oxidase